MPHPYRDVAIAAAFNTRQAKALEGYDSLTIGVEAAVGVIAEAGIATTEIDGVFGQFAGELTYLLGIGPCHTSFAGSGGIPELIDAANAIATGYCSTVLMVGGGAGIYTETASVAPWARA